MSYFLCADVGDSCQTYGLQASTTSAIPSFHPAVELTTQLPELSTLARCLVPPTLSSKLPAKSTYLLFFHSQDNNTISPSTIDGLNILVANDEPSPHSDLTVPSTHHSSFNLSKLLLTINRRTTIPQDGASTRRLHHPP